VWRGGTLLGDTVPRAASDAIDEGVDVLSVAADALSVAVAVDTSAVASAAPCASDHSDQVA
jgi:hypothetical protein